MTTRAVRVVALPSSSYVASPVTTKLAPTTVETIAEDHRCLTAQFEPTHRAGMG
jgi:hypothetical protein